MPQIKFSGLVTDMKGKAGGSVFSSNKQGAYMRNNKWGGGRKSQRWDVSKSRLASLSNAWRLLTAEQQQAWNNAAADYPFTNKFKEQYIGSGYQVYMSLNGNLLANGLPILSAPAAKRPIPEDLYLSFSNPDLPWVTGGTGATFPNISALLSTSCSDDEECSYGFMCIDNVCTAVNTPFSPAWDKEQQQIKAVFNQFEPIGCETDQDCVDAGLTGGSADVACTNGECVYVGDGFLNWSNFSYVLNIDPALFNNGNWDQTNSTTEAEINGSFRFTLGPKTLRLLQTTSQEIVLVSNYYDDGRGLSIRIRPQDQNSTRVYITYGLFQDQEETENATYEFYQDILTSALTNSTVMQFRVNLANTNQTHFSVGNTGWLPMQLNTYLGLQTGPISTWIDVFDTHANPFSNWSTIEKWQGVVYGGGILGNMTDIVYSDIRFYETHYTDYLKPLIGYLNGLETVLILANGEAKPKCNYVSCNTDLTGICKPEKTCSCRHSVCGTWGQNEGIYRNAAPNGSNKIVLWPSVPAADLDEVSPGVFTYKFAGFWMRLDGEYSANNGATYVPNVLLDITASIESGFVGVFRVSNPKGYNGNSRWSPLKWAGTIDISVSSVINMWEYISAAIVNAPAGTSFDVEISILDSTSGFLPQHGKKTIRFKAGAELSSSVN